MQPRFPSAGLLGDLVRYATLVELLRDLVFNHVFKLFGGVLFHLFSLGLNCGDIFMLYPDRTVRRLGELDEVIEFHMQSRLTSCPAHQNDPRDHDGGDGEKDVESEHEAVVEM